MEIELGIFFFQYYDTLLCGDRKYWGGGGGPTPFFPKTHRNLDLGMGKNGEKSIWKEREKVFVLTNCCTLLSLFSAF